MNCHKCNGILIEGNGPTWCPTCEPVPDGEKAAAKKDPPLTVDSFYEKTLALNEVYVNNMKFMQEEFYKKQQALFDRLSDDDKSVVIMRETEKFREAAKGIVTQDHGLVDSQGRKIGTA